MKDANRSNEIRRPSVDLTKHLKVMNEYILPALPKIVYLPKIQQRKRNNQYLANQCLPALDVTLEITNVIQPAVGNLVP